MEVDHEYRIELSGDFKRYIDDKLYLEGKYEGATFTGKIHKADGEIISGVWTKGDFLNVKYAKGNQITEITRISENSFTWENYEKSVLIKKFTVVNNQLEGDFYSKTDKGTIRSKYKNGIITWAKLDEKSLKYEGYIKDSMYDGQGRLEDDAIIYTGQFQKGVFHGEGAIYFKQDKGSISGTFEMGNPISIRET